MSTSILGKLCAIDSMEQKALETSEKGSYHCTAESQCGAVLCQLRQSVDLLLCLQGRQSLHADLLQQCVLQSQAHQEHLVPRPQGSH